MVQEILAFFKIPWIAAFTAVFFWWFLTGLILFIVKKVDEINQRAHKFVTLILCPVFFLGFYLYLTSLSNVDASLMLMVMDKLRVGIVTNHIPVSEIKTHLSTEIIQKKLVRYLSKVK